MKYLNKTTLRLLTTAMRGEHNMEKLIETFFRCVGSVPKQYADKLSEFLGNIWFKIDKRHRNIAKDNLRRAFGNKTSDEIEMLAKHVFQHLMRLIFDITWYFGIRDHELGRYFQIRGAENLTPAYARKKGVLILTAHAGNWEFLSALAPLLNMRGNILYRPLDFAPLNNFFIRYRTRFGTNLISTAHSMRKILSELRKGEAVAMLMDQNVDWYEGVFADFFGHPACTNKGLALIALKTECPVVPVFIVRDKQGFTAEIMPEIPLVKTGDKISDVEENTRQYNHAIETMIRKYPEQWFWVHQRWKTKSFCHLNIS